MTAHTGSRYVWCLMFKFGCLELCLALARQSRASSRTRELSSWFWLAKFGANDAAKVRHYKQNGGENQARLKANFIVALRLSDAASVAG
ncbi:DNA-binding transcriptional repressor [Marinobacter sp. ELB17]|nr:DNA-binding transcriptional repressor [Marinobacter sp. ELB17]